MKTYNEYYLECREAYQKENPSNSMPSVQDFYNFGFLVGDVDSSGKNSFYPGNKYFTKYIKDIQNDLKNRFENRDECWIVPGLNEQLDFAIRIKNIWNIQSLEQLCELILPSIEKTIFGCYVSLIGIYAYRNRFRLSTPRSSWQWHFDNHPKEILKIMIYLNDVTRENGPIEIVTNKEGSPLKMPTSRIDYKNWGSTESRITKTTLEKFLKNDYKPKEILGKAGTICIFDNNIIHKAGLCRKDQYRDAIVLMIKPSHKQSYPYISTKYTGTNYHKDIQQDPEIKEVVRRC